MFWALPKCRWKIARVPDCGRHRSGEVAINKTRIALKRLALPLLADVYVENAQLALGTDEDRVLLKQFIDKEDIFIVLFDQPRFAYLDGNLYQDDIPVNGGSQFLGYLFGNAELATITDEKAPHRCPSYV